MDRATQLRIFSRVVATGNFSAVAKAEAVTPSAISKVIGKLENEFGFRLFVRTSRSLTLTPEGSAVHARVIDALEALDSIGDLAQSLSNKPRGQLRVHTMLTFGRYKLAPIIKEFADLHPAIKIDLLLAPQFTGLFDDAIDVAIHSGLPPDSALVSKEIYSTRWVVCASPQYLKRYGNPSKPADLAQHKCLNFTWRTAWSAWKFNERDGLAEQPIEGPIRADHGEMVLELALCGAGVARLAEYHVASFLRSGALVRVLDEYQDPTRYSIYAIYSVKKRFSPRLRAFLDFVEARLERPVATD